MLCNMYAYEMETLNIKSRADFILLWIFLHIMERQIVFHTERNRFYNFELYLHFFLEKSLTNTRKQE